MGKSQRFFDAGLRYFSVTVLLLASVQTCPASSPPAANEPVLVLNDANEPPFTTPAGDGFLDLIANETFRRAGLRLHLIKLPAERALRNANAGIEDGDLTRIAGLEKDYPNLIPVPEKLMDWTFAAFAVQTKPAEASWAILESFVVGHIKGWKIFEKNLRPATSVTTADNPLQLFTMLDKKRVEVVLYERWMGYALMKQMNMTGVHAIEPPLAVREMFIYLHRRHADKIPAITAALRAIKSEGIYTRICREKFSPLGTPPSQCEVR